MFLCNCIIRVEEKERNTGISQRKEWGGRVIDTLRLLSSDVVIKKCSWPPMADFTGLGSGGTGSVFHIFFLFVCFLLLLHVYNMLMKEPHFFSEYIVFCLITPKHFWRNCFKWNLQEMRSYVGFVYRVIVEEFRSSINVRQTVKYNDMRSLYRYFFFPFLISAIL